MAAKKTMSDFNETFHKSDAYYIFYVDDDSDYMHFLSEADCIDFDASDLNDAVYTDNLSDAVLCTYEQAKTLVFLCDYLFPKHIHQIVNIHTSVEWL